MNKTIAAATTLVLGLAVGGAVYASHDNDRTQDFNDSASFKNGGYFKATTLWTPPLAPNQEAVAIAPAVDGPRSCRFIVEGTAENFRASGLVVLPGVGSISALKAE